MRAVVQRVSRAQVIVDGEVVGKIGPGLLVLLASRKLTPRLTPTTLRRKFSGCASLKIKAAR